MSDDKITGFKITDEMSKNLKKEIFRSGKTKKNWLADRVEDLQFLDKTRNKPNEKWTLVPNSELEELHSTGPDHYIQIHQRILEHCLQQNLPITFDNLLTDCTNFYNFNNMKYVRYTDDDIEVLVIEHDVGQSYSNFTSKLLCKFLNVTTQYDLVSTNPSENKIIIKFQKKVN